MKVGGLFVLGLVIIVGVGMDGMGIEVLVELRRSWIWFGIGSVEGIWVLGVVMEVGIVGGICVGIRISIEIWVVDIIDFFVFVVVVFCIGGGISLILDVELLIIIIFCVWIVLLVSEVWLWLEGNWVVGWVFDELDDGCEVRNNYFYVLEYL